ncbi:hypothetical protein KBY22_06990 [Ruegeria pomeroyi]|uniref:Uncharacterized protein n=1 Tax=Ruegeria alba TaxID=2916756 RepID=A0ABS9NXQ1_9RHOB|nr:hypothetical protein [Ruegeria alba]MCE8512432.1 hypothetical protein [Ruegeria pomeroyi]MCE8528939.1 hypothetical protein [Ruegeria pomeroyi]MCG6558988.1 hypothetical protein [Ruegeria alba]
MTAETIPTNGLGSGGLATEPGLSSTEPAEALRSVSDDDCHHPIGANAELRNRMMSAMAAEECYDSMN